MLRRRSSIHKVFQLGNHTAVSVHQWYVFYINASMYFCGVRSQGNDQNHPRKPWLQNISHSVICHLWPGICVCAAEPQKKTGVRVLPQPWRFTPGRCLLPPKYYLPSCGAATRRLACAQKGVAVLLTNVQSGINLVVTVSQPATTPSFLFSAKGMSHDGTNCHHTCSPCCLNLSICVWEAVHPFILEMWEREKGFILFPFVVHPPVLCVFLLFLLFSTGACLALQ